MKKNINIIKTINFIIQKQQKGHYHFVFHFINKMQKNLLNFLWIQKFIYGYQIIKNNYCILYLKNRKRNNKQIFNKHHQEYKKKNIIKMKNWSKNNFFIINKNKTFLSINKINLLKIGGFLSYKIS